MRHGHPHPQGRVPRSRRAWTIGHEPVGVIEKLGRNVVGYTEGQRVIAFLV
ncbi:MAG: alcohol dehydrogenase catalytic domain-containing protein [Geminicoccaceae bacterium]